jgi:uncharacterized protein YcfL
MKESQSRATAWFTHTYVRTITLLLVLYWYDTWSLTSREEHRLRIFATKVLRETFQLKAKEITGKWRKNYTMWSFIIC